MVNQIRFGMRPGRNKNGTNKAIMLVGIYFLLRRCDTPPLAVIMKNSDTRIYFPCMISPVGVELQQTDSSKDGAPYTTIQLIITQIV